MTNSITCASLLLGLTSLATAQGPPSGSPFGGGDNPFSSGNNGGSGSDYGGFPGGFEGQFGPPAGTKTIVMAHAILATVAFGLLFPFGGIMIRLASFRGVWIVHGIFQIIAYCFYIAAFGCGIWMAKHARVMHEAHPIIGIVLLVLILFQPFLGFLHHFAFKKHSRRVFWSYAHIWLGRFVITLGIVNGGLGLKLGKNLGIFAPSQGNIIGYSVAAAVIWLIYVASAIYGENKRRKTASGAAGQGPPPYKREGGSESDVQYA